MNIDGIPVWSLTPSFLLGLTVLYILMGRLVPRKTYDDKVHEANEWRAEGRIKDQQIAELNRQLNIVVEVAANVHAVMNAIQNQETQNRRDSP